MNERFNVLWRQWNRIWSQHLMKPTGRRTRGLRSGLSLRVPAEIELLEAKSMLSAASVLSTTYAEPTYELVGKTSSGTVHPDAASSSSAYTPSQISSAYGFNSVSQTGTGQTIAIIDAYNDPNIKADLQTFDNTYGLAAPPSFSVISQTGSTTALPSADSTGGWEVEESLDVEWAHALAPGANIVLVEANSSSYSDLFAAVREAESISGVSVISMSWGGGEFSGETAYDSVFTTPAGHTGITFVASTGDNAAPAGYPAYSPNVLAVGGTTLTTNSSGGYVSESGWADSGGGISTYESQPTYQSGIVTQSTTRRTAPDVSFDADPNTGVAVYDSFPSSSGSGWFQVGGTSFSAPSWGAIIARVDQARAANGLATLNGPTQTMSMLYQLDKSNPSAFHDITTGSNGYSAGPGYDLVTGLGSPVVNVLIPALSGSSTTSGASKLAIQQAPSTGVAGQTLGSLKVDLENSSGQLITSDNSTVTISVASGPGGFASGSTQTVNAVNGVATFSNLNLTTAGSYTFTVTDGSYTSATTGSVVISAAAASRLTFQQVPASGTVGNTLSAVIVDVVDQYGNLVTTNNTAVTLSVASGPGGFAAGSTLTVSAVNGVATFSNLKLGTAGSYTLGATDGSLTKATSTAFSVTSGLSAPQNVVITATSSTTARMSWSAVNGTLGYRVYEVIGAQSYLLGTLSSSTTSVTISGMRRGTTYAFKVEAYNSTSIADSAIVSVTMSATKLTVPAVSIVNVTSNVLILDWTPSAGAQGYRVYEMVGSTKTLLGTLPAGANSATIEGLSQSTKYQFLVEAYAGSTVKDSSWMTVTTPSSHSRSAFVANSGYHSPFDWDYDN